MKQMTLATAGFERYAKTTRRAEFLAQMNHVVPWDKLCALVFPVYPKAGDGRPPIELERMIRIHCLQHWFNLSDPSMEESLHDSVSSPIAGAPNTRNRSLVRTGLNAM